MVRMLYQIIRKAGLNNRILSLGMLLRYFVNFYDMEIIEEEAFLAWKEDITQEFPGKGKALFQVLLWFSTSVVWTFLKNLNDSGECDLNVSDSDLHNNPQPVSRKCEFFSVFGLHQVNQWLTWLETAEEEESEDEAD